MYETIKRINRMEVKYEREKIQVGYMTVSALTVVESRRVFSSEGKKENLTASIYPPPVYII